MSRHSHEIEASSQLRNVRYEIRGTLARRAHELERQGYEITQLNIGNPGLFGLRTPETMRLAMIENLASAEAYCNQKGIFPAREAVVMQQQARGIDGVTADHVFMGNGVSELIDLTLRGLLNPGDEVLIPSPDYPLWTAATVLNGGKAVYYPCPESQGFNPDPDAIEKLVTPRTRALVIINPNNPTGAVYSRERLTALARLAERHSLVVMSDEIYDQMLYDGAEFVPMATLCRDTLCATFSGLSKVYRACGYRVGWVSFSGAVDRSERYMNALDLLAALRLCSNVPGQWAVQTALGGFQSIAKLCSPGGRLYQSRAAVIDGVAASRFMHVVAPRGAMYAFIGVDKQKLPGFDDEAFAMELLEQQHVLVAPGSSFNTPYRDHFRITTLPDEARLGEVFQRIEHVLEQVADRPPHLENGLMAQNARAAHARSTIVVADALAAQQWEMHLAAEPIRRGAPAWETLDLLAYSAWLDTLWAEHASDRGPALTAAQSFALWRRVVAESEESGELIGHAGAAEWAAGAWQLLHRWRIDPAAERAAADQLDYRALLGWCRSYRERLDGHGWIDRAQIEAVLGARVGGDGALIAAELDSYPARAALFAELAARGREITTASAPAIAGEQRATRLADGADELRAAFAWAKRHLTVNPSARVALIVPTVARRKEEVDRLATATFGAIAQQVCWSEGSTLASDPTIGAAFNALTLLTASTRYAAFGRWLRSPFFAAPSEEQFARARLDRELRTELRSQLSFQAAYRCGLKELLRERAPRSAQALAAGLAAVVVRRATPSRWAHLAARFLAELGWQPPMARNVLLGWQSTLDELSRLTPILGEVSLDTVLAELGRTLERTVPLALPLSGVHVLRHIDEVGPGYDAVWVTGFTDAAWPEPPHGNPLLPLALQRAHGMPYSSPRDAQERSERALGRLVGRTADLVVSWPARIYDYETEPSPAIRQWPTLSAAELDALAAPPSPHTAQRETTGDAAPAFAGTRLPGGTGALGRQARCPLRAFCHDRLGARTLEPIGFGLSGRMRGIATHHAAELLLGDLPSQSALAGVTETAIVQSVERALARLFGAARGRLPALYELEKEQLHRVLTALLRQEAGRGPFRVRAVEQRGEIALGPWTLGVRIDRIDELADGSIAIIDYKTGERATSADWFGPRLRDAQVPLYASHAADVVTAAVVARLTPTNVSYFGFWPDGAFPGRQSKTVHSERATQLDIWRAQLIELARELAAGDTRIFVADYDDAAGAYAPLTRVFEQLALLRGTVAPW